MQPIGEIVHGLNWRFLIEEFVLDISTFSTLSKCDYNYLKTFYGTIGIY